MWYYYTVSQSTRPRTRIGGSGAHGGRGMLLRASACRATALVCATAERYKQHTIGRSLSRRQRLRPRQAPNSEHKAYKGSEAIGHHNAKLEIVDGSWPEASGPFPAGRDAPVPRRSGAQATQALS